MMTINSNNNNNNNNNKTTTTTTLFLAIRDTIAIKKCMSIKI